MTKKFQIEVWPQNLRALRAIKKAVAITVLANLAIRDGLPKTRKRFK